METETTCYNGRRSDGRNADSSRERNVATYFEAYNGLTVAALTGRYQRFLDDDNRWPKIDVITLTPENQRSISVHSCQTVGPKSCKRRISLSPSYKPDDNDDVVKIILYIAELKEKATL